MKSATLVPSAAMNARPLPVSSPAQLKLFEAWLATGRCTYSEALERSCWGIAPMEGGAVDSTQGTKIQNAPLDAPFEFNPAAFFASTETNWYKAGEASFAIASSILPFKIPEVGIVSKLVITFDGSVTCSATGTSTAAFPYGLLEEFQLSVNGQDDLFSCSGIELKVLERARRVNSGNNDGDIVGPGVGAGLTVAATATPLRLTYEVPLSVDEASMVGSVLAQNRALSMFWRGKSSTTARLFSGGGTVTWAGSWHVTVVHNTIPIVQGKMLLPDIRYLHGFNALVQPFSAAGDIKVALTRSISQLQRIFVQGLKDSTVPTYYDPAVAADISEFRFEYAGNQRPLVFNPGAGLVRQNAMQYNGKLPYSYAALDFVRDNPVRDSINLAGITEAYVIPKTVAAPTNGQIRVVMETLYA
jgi:hypothetical protein